jgi:flagellar protein FlbD
MAVFSDSGNGWLRGNMIEVTRMNNTKLTINAELIETVEETPDTLITMTSGHKMIVKESRQEIKNRVVLYKAETLKPVYELLGRDGK